MVVVSQVEEANLNWTQHFWGAKVVNKQSERSESYYMIIGEQSEP